MADRRPLLLPTDGIDLYLMDQEAIAYSRPSRRLFYLNTAATYVWLCLEEGLLPAEVACRVAAQFRIAIEKARSDVNGAIAAWQAQGLLVETTHPSHCENSQRVVPGQLKCRFPTPGHSEAPANTSKSPNSTRTDTSQENDVGARMAVSQTLANVVFAAKPVTHFYGVGDLDFCIRYHCKAAAVAHPFLAHLRTSGARAEACRTTFDVVELDRNLWLLDGSDSGFGPLADKHLVPRIHQLVLMAAYRSSDCLAALHAGAVGTADHCMVLPGAAGSGKSTLVAAMMAVGLDYLTDELVLLMPDGYACAMPLSAGLKKGAWRLLSNYFPALAEAPLHVQPDGTEVRYLVPAPRNATNSRHLEISAVVFPQYTPGSKTQLEPLSPAQAMVELAAAGYAVHEGLSPATVAKLIPWMQRQPARYRLRFDDLAEAVAVLQRICR